MECSKCRRKAVVQQRYSGLRLCETHFLEDVERKIKRRLRKEIRLRSGDVLAVALSGGKDSSVLLYALCEIFGRRRDISVVAITVDEGIEGYRAKYVRRARKLADELSVDLFLFSFKDEFGVTLDEVVRAARRDPDLRDKAPCTFCGVLRKTLLNRVGRELGVAAIATAHNLDDEAQTILMNYIRGDVTRLFRRSARSERFVPRIKPLRDVPEEEVALYGMLKGLEIEFEECPYKRLSFRFEILSWLNDFERRHPGTRYSILRGFERLVQHGWQHFELKSCERCGEPCAGNLCQACKILSRISPRTTGRQAEVEK
ncbi:MAG: TIGR00269 family protein [Candidatus Alkanophagales archaeon]